MTSRSALDFSSASPWIGRHPGCLSPRGGSYMRKTWFLSSGLLVGALFTLGHGCSDDAGDASGGGGSTGNGNPLGCSLIGEECGVLCDDDLGCVECNSSADCGAAQPSCVLGECVE